MKGKKVNRNSRERPTKGVAAAVSGGGGGGVLEIDTAILSYSF